MGSKTMRVKEAGSQSAPASTYTAPQRGSGTFFTGVGFRPVESLPGLRKKRNAENTR